MTKKCNGKCQKELDIKKFRSCLKYADGHSNVCKICESEKVKEYYYAKKKEKQEYDLMFGIF